MAIRFANLAKFSAILCFACSAWSVNAAKPVQKQLSSKVASAGVFSQEFLLLTNSDYSNQLGAIYALGLSSTFDSLSIEIETITGPSLTGTLTGTIGGALTSNSWKATFNDKSSPADLLGQTKYLLHVWGSSKVAGAEYLINSTGIQTISAVPEPSNAMMFLTGLGLFGVISLKRAKRR